jgi:hypothetical protein
MKKSKPPALASWMLDHLLWGGRNEALAGDLLEEFQRRRSVAWYWRQVIGAIFASFSNEVRADWVMVWTIVFTFVWVYALYAIPPIAAQLPLPLPVITRLLHYFSTHYRGTLIWYALPYALVDVLPFLFHVAAPLAVYLVVARNMNIRSFAWGLCAAVLLSAVLGIVPFQPVLDFLSQHGLAYYWVQLWKLYEVAVMRQFVPLLAAMWVAQSRKKKIAQPAIIAS